MEQKQDLSSNPPQYPPPPPAYTASQAHHSTVMFQPTMVVQQTFKETPVRTTCPHCSADIVTSTNYETGTITWVACLVLAFFGLWLGCCLVPFCMNSCKDVIHTCPNCKQQVGRFNRM